MKTVFLNRKSDSEFTVQWFAGRGGKQVTFTSLPEARRFADAKMGKTGMVVEDTRCGGVVANA